MSSRDRLLAFFVCAGLLLVALWFQPEMTNPSDAAANTEPENAKTAPVSAPAESRTVPKMVVLEPFAATCRADVEARLAEPIPEITFEQLPLSEVVTELTKLSGITIYFDEEELGDVIDPDVPIDVHAVADSMSFKTLIERFVLEPNDLTFVVRDRFLMIMSYDKSLVASKEVVIYDCRDLLWGPRGNSATAGEPGRFNHRYHAPSVRGIQITDAMHLMQIIQYTIRNEDYPWDDGTAFGDEHVGTMEAVNGLLVIQTIPSIHERVQQLLDSLRQMVRH